MTEFKKHDRVRVVESPEPFGDGPIKGQVYTVLAARPGGYISVADNGIMWFGEFFELVESAVGKDRNGEPLYVGDVVQGPSMHQAIVREQVDRRVRVSWGGTTYTLESGEIQLTRHHWEQIPSPDEAVGYADPLMLAVDRLNAVMEESQTRQRDALAQIVASARSIAEKPKLPTAPGSIVATSLEKEEAHLIGGRWLYAGNGGRAFPDHWPSWTLIRDAGVEAD